MRWWRLPIEEGTCRKTDLGGGAYYLRNSGLPPSSTMIWYFLYMAKIWRRNFMGYFIAMPSKLHLVSDREDVVGLWLFCIYMVKRFAFFLIAGILSDNNVIKIMSDILILCPSSTNISEPIQFCLNCWRMRFICVLTEWFYCEKQASFTQYTEHFPKELPYCISVTYILDCIFW